MSHIVTVDVKITNLNTLERAAKTLGFKKLSKTGFEAYFSKGSAFFGVCKKADNTLEFKSDLYYFKGMETLKQEYAKEELLQVAYDQGLTVKSCTKKSNGEYEIEISR